MKRFSEAERFAARLHALRERADYSYEVLAQKTNISRSSLHRYCTGSSVPQDYGAAHRIATVCGATPAELRELHRLWALAGTERENDASPEEGETTGQGEETEELSAEDDPDALGAPPAEPPETVRKQLPRARGRRRTAVVSLVGAFALALVAWGVSLIISPPGPAGPRGAAGAAGAAQDRQLLFQDACEPVVSMGQHDACVRELQLRLHSRGADIGVDGSFGPETLRRVTAFQVRAGIAPNGVVTDATKKALYESGVRMDTWSPEKVRRRIREVFTEAPDDAVAIADCQSFLDPLHILPNTNGTRNWGVFQISDGRLRELGGTPGQALDPEWNIQAAKRLWSQKRDFHDWPHCERALTRTPTP